MTTSRAARRSSSSTVPTNRGRGAGGPEPIPGRVEPSGERVEPIGGRLEPIEARVEPIPTRVEPSGARLEPIGGCEANRGASRTDRGASRTERGTSRTERGLVGHRRTTRTDRRTTRTERWVVQHRRTTGTNRRTSRLLEVRDQVIGHASQVGGAPNVAQLIGRVRRSSQPDDRIGVVHRASIAPSRSATPTPRRRRRRRAAPEMAGEARSWGEDWGHGALSNCYENSCRSLHMFHRRRKEAAGPASN